MDMYGTFQDRNGEVVSSRFYPHWIRIIGIILTTSYLITQCYQSSSIVLTSTLTASSTSLEQTFINHVDPTHLRTFLHAYASVPHVAGSKQDYDTALYTAQQLESYGIQADIQVYYPLLSLPIHRRVMITAPLHHQRELNLTEASIPNDTCTTDPNALPPFLAYSSSGNITAPILYVNYGAPEDYKALLAQNITLKDKIALIRYGHNFRGLKVMLAESYGMIGVLLYSDPEDDGATKGPTYPQGPYRPQDSFQRGSLQYLSLYAGDPLTPGYASTLDAPRISVEDATSIPHIPALPLSSRQARYLFQAMGGTKAPSSFQGGLDLVYYLGDDEETIVNLDVEMKNEIGPIWNVIGTIPGREEWEQEVWIGNHRDAWVCGAVDPSSGSAALLEVARGVGKLIQQGWQPRRTIKFASWDGEEYGLLGSTEYVEEHKVHLQKHAVAYLNVDNVAGKMVTAGGTPSIAALLIDAAKMIPALGNEQGQTLYDQWTAQVTSLHGNDPYWAENSLAPDHLVTLLGSGTDYTAFSQHIGVISANLLFTIDDRVPGTYHSTMDSVRYAETVDDPSYETLVATSQWWGLIAMRLASSSLLPLYISSYSTVMMRQVEGLQTQTKNAGLNVDFSTLQQAINEFEMIANQLDSHSIQEWNTKVLHLEQEWITQDGLPHRPWYRHLLCGPGFYKGYEGTAFPGIADALIFHDNIDQVQVEIDEVVRVIVHATQYLTRSL